MTKKITLEDLKTIDLDDLQKEIDADEAALKQIVDAKRAEIDGKRQLHKTIYILVNGRPERKKRVMKPRVPTESTNGTARGDETLQKVYRCLQVSGATTVAAIAK